MPSPPSDRAHIERAFPGLRVSTWEVTSPFDRLYNCVAWAIGDNSAWWWPIDGRWPDGVRREVSVAAFSQAFSLMGFEPCEDGSLEEDIEKISLYAKGDRPTHVARQLQNGRWSSKLGQAHDIVHPRAEGLEGDRYGTLVRYFRRKLARA